MTICDENEVEYSDDILSDSKYYDNFDGIVRNQIIVRDDGIFFMAYLNLGNPAIVDNYSIRSKSLHIYKLSLAQDGSSVSFVPYDVCTIGGENNVLFANKTLKNDIYVAVNTETRKIYSIATKELNDYSEETFNYPKLLELGKGTEFGHFNKITYDGVSYNFPDLFYGYWPLTRSTVNEQMKKAFEFDPMATGPGKIRYYAMFFDNRDAIATKAKEIMLINPEEDWYIDNEDYNWRRNCYYGNNFLCAPNAVVALNAAGQIVDVKKFDNSFRIMGAVASSLVYGIVVEGATIDPYNRRKDPIDMNGKTIYPPDFQDWETCGIPEGANEKLIIYYPAKYGMNDSEVIEINLNEQIYDVYGINPRDYVLFVNLHSCLRI